MKTHHRYLSLLALPLALIACGDDDARTVDIRGLTAEEAADEAADALCDRAAECGEVSYECSSDGTTQVCTGTIETTSYTACYAETQPEIRADLEDCELTTAQEELVNECMNAMLAQPCLTQDQVDANAEAMEQDLDPPYGGTPPAACAQVGEIFEACDDSTPQ
jgi:hypothetical protein